MTRLRRRASPRCHHMVKIRRLALDERTMLKGTTMRDRILLGAVLAGLLLALGLAPAMADEQTSAKYNENEIANSVADFFGTTTEGAAQAVERVFKDQGEPNAYIRGEEASGAFIGGLRYGKGELIRKGYPPVLVYWQGPSIGFDFGGNASKTFVLIYNLKNIDDLFTRFPGAEATGYFVAGIGVNYQQSGDIIVAPMRTGVGLRAGVNVGYLQYTRERHWFPF
jgi:hypothetical protein